MRRGEVVAGKYRLVRELGAGAQGRVWEAVHLQMGTPLALKMLDPNLAATADYVARFKREASAAAALRSSHVVQIFDFGVADSGMPYIAMELLEGEDLGTRLDRITRLKPAAVSSVVTQVARALVRAHKRGIIHRDLKPDNIFLCASEDEGELVKVLDFGVAKGVGGINLARTGTGIVVGTPYYMSPEQAQGEKRIDHRTDLWAVGVIDFEAMIGRRPFEATNLGDLLVKICTASPPRPSSVWPNVPLGFDEWFLRACARKPEDRFNTAKEMAATLAVICGSVPPGLSDSSYVGVPTAVPPDREAMRQAASVRLVEPREASGAADDEETPDENDPTQVMVELPEEIRNAAGIVRLIDDDATPSEPRTVLERPPVERVAPRPVAVQAPPRAPAQKLPAPIPAPPAARTPAEPVSKPPAAVHQAKPPAAPARALHSPPPVHEPEVTDDDDDAVELFDAKELAANIAREQRLQQERAARERRLAFVKRWALPFAILFAFSVAAVVVVLLTRK